MTFTVLRVSTYINVSTGSILSLYKYKKNHKSGQILHAGPLRAKFWLPEVSSLSSLDFL